MNTHGTDDRNGLAVTAMALGTIGLAGSIVSVGGVLGVVGLVLGVLALRKAARTGVGRGQAVTGLVTSAAAIVMSIAVAFLAVWFAHRTQSCYQYHQIHEWTQCVHRQFDGRH